MEGEGHQTLNPVDPVAIIEDDQQLYDWGIEHRLDQYYGDGQPPPPNFQYPPQKAQYMLPEHIQQQENAYLVTVPEADTKKGLKSETKARNVKPNSGLPGRRPMLPAVDMDANELLKVRRFV